VGCGQSELHSHANRNARHSRLITRLRRWFPNPSGKERRRDGAPGNGTPGLHFYPINQVDPTLRLRSNLALALPA
jgi:hypothetical protein